jgi:hypothetical protein
MRISDIRSVQEIEHNIVDPVTGDELGGVIILAGPIHPKRREATLERKKKARASLARNRGADPWKAFLNADLDEETHEETEFMVACTIGWRDIEEDAGKPLEFSADAARKLYSAEQYNWLRVQVAAKLAVDENFTRNTSRK